MNQYLYPIFQTSTKNNCNDLTIGLAMFLSDASRGVQQYGPDGVDYAQLHQDYEKLAAEEGNLRRFIGRHYKALVGAYKHRDQEIFDRTVAECVAKDEEKKKEAERETEEE